MAILRRRNRADDDFYEAMPATSKQYGYAEPQVAPVLVERDRTSQLIYFVASVAQVMLGLRLLLRLLGASTGSAFVSFIYSVTAPLIAPFAGIFNLTIDNAVANFEVATVLAMIVYGLAAYLLVALVRATKGIDTDL